MNDSRLDRRESPARTLTVAAIVCLICSLFVSSSVQWLRARTAENLRSEREARITEILARQPALADIVSDLSAVDLRARIVELESGEYVDGADAAAFDPELAARDPESSIELPPDRDLAGLGRRALHGVVYEVWRDDRLELVILPVQGAGYVSMIRGYLALSRDGNTVAGLAFYEHRETPGIGAEIEDEPWLASWEGKRLRDEAGGLRINVSMRGASEASDPSFRVDGISGATRTSNAVSQLVRFWVGDDGYGAYLRRIGP